MSSPGGQDYRDLARSLLGLLEVARRTLVDEEGPTELVARVTGHLGCELPDVVAVHERFQIWDHVNIQRGVEAYLTRHGSAGTWFGMTTGMMHHHQDLLSRLAMPAPGPMGRAGSATYGTAATGPDTDTEVVTLGLIATTAPGGAPTVIGIRAEREFGPPYGELEILAADRDAVRYLTGKLTATTVILLTGRSIRFVESAAALARRLQPSMVVLEDVDLIAMDRDFSDGSHPLLFTLLDAMDGVGSDADVTFVLTTNRADILEQALADRPGRVDLAIEIPRPDAVCREQLLRLYTRDVTLDCDTSAVVAATEGVTASYIKELVRRAVLAALRARERPLVLRQPHFEEVLAEMSAEHQSLTRSLLGGDAVPRDGRAQRAPHRPRR